MECGPADVIGIFVLVPAVDGTVGREEQHRANQSAWTSGAALDLRTRLGWG